MYINSLYENPFEHSRGDRLERLDLAMIERVASSGLAAVLQLARER